MEDDVVDRMCRSGAVDLICIDSVSALTPRAEIALKFFSSVRLEIRNWEDKIELCRLQVSGTVYIHPVWTFCLWFCILQLHI
ncbi:hypothetical protein ACS0TY_016287 [Phlomoides rotata]